MGNSITALVQENRLDELRVRLSEPDCDPSDPDELNDEYESPLQIACQMNSVAAVTLLVAHPRIQHSLNYAPHFQWNLTPSLPPVGIAVAHNHVTILKLLLEAGADANQKWGEANVTPLNVAAMAGYAAIARLLIQHGAVVTDPDALFFACEFGNENLVQILLDAGARAVIEVVNEADTQFYGARMRVRNHLYNVFSFSFSFAFFEKSLCTLLLLVER